MKGKVAHYISVIFHPLLMPSLLFLILFDYAPFTASPLTEEGRRYVLLTIFITTFVLPLVSVAVLKLSNNITDLRMEKREERIIPFVFISMFYSITTYMFISKIQMNETFTIIILSITFLILLITIITFFWKISVHSAATTGTWGFLLAVNYKYPGAHLLFPIIGFVLLSGIVMSCRLYLNAHKPEEVLGGGLLGLCLGIVPLIFFG